MINNSKALLDISYLHQILRGDVQKINTVLHQFLTEFPAHWQSLQEAVQQKQQTQIRFHAHKLKSSVQLLSQHQELLTILQTMEDHPETIAELPARWVLLLHQLKEEVKQALLA